MDLLTVDRVEWSYEKKNGRLMHQDRQVIEQSLKTAGDLVLIAIGFQGPECGPFADAGIKTKPRGTIKIDHNMMTDLPGVFAAGDANRDQSIVVWAIGEGRDVARCINIYLISDSRLPASLRTPNPPIGRL